MWVFTNHGFYSIVKDWNSDDLWVRSRQRNHLESLFDSKRIEYYKERDYQYRVKASKQETKDLFSHWPEDITYSNFKDSIYDGLLKSCAHSVWKIIHSWLDERSGALEIVKEERTRSHGANRKPGRKRRSRRPRVSQRKNTVVRIEDWKRK
tara:strand:+ start:7128 stop:7580 length:453 start_codon:yes stop_codon:yes gene_type:complete